MLIPYQYLKNSPEWFEFFEKMRATGHIAPVERYERATPSDPIRSVYPMEGFYISDRGQKCWPWVRYVAPSSYPYYKGYILRDVAPLPPVPAKPIASVPQRATRRKPAKPAKERPKGKARQAAEWFVKQQGNVTRAAAAELYGISLSALCVALYKYKNVPKSLRQSRGARAVRWMIKHPGYTRNDVARLFNLTYAGICRAIQAQDVYIPTATRHDLTADEIDQLRRVRGLFDEYTDTDEEQ